MLFHESESGTCGWQLLAGNRAIRMRCRMLAYSCPLLLVC